MQDDLIQLKLHFPQHTQFFVAIIDVKLTLINKSSLETPYSSSWRPTGTTATSEGKYDDEVINNWWNVNGSKNNEDQVAYFLLDAGTMPRASPIFFVFSWASFELIMSLGHKIKALLNANDGDMCKITDVEQGLTFDF